MLSLPRYVEQRRRRIQRVQPTFRDRVHNAVTSVLSCLICGADRNVDADAVVPFRSQSSELVNTVRNIRAAEIGRTENESRAEVCNSESSDFSSASLPGPRSASASLPGSTFASLPGSTSASLPGSTSASLPGSTSASMPASTSASMPGSTSASMPGSTSASLPGSTSASIPGSTSASMPGSTNSRISVVEHGVEDAALLLNPDKGISEHRCGTLLPNEISRLEKNRKVRPLSKRTENQHDRTDIREDVRNKRAPYETNAAIQVIRREESSIFEGTKPRKSVGKQYHAQLPDIVEEPHFEDVQENEAVINKARKSSALSSARRSHISPSHLVLDGSSQQLLSSLQKHPINPAAKRLQSLETIREDDEALTRKENQLASKRDQITPSPFVTNDTTRNPPGNWKKPRVNPAFYKLQRLQTTQEQDKAVIRNKNLLATKKDQIPSSPLVTNGSTQNLPGNWKKPLGNPALTKLQMQEIIEDDDGAPIRNILSSKRNSQKAVPSPLLGNEPIPTLSSPTQTSAAYPARGETLPQGSSDENEASICKVPPSKSYFNLSLPNIDVSSQKPALFSSNKGSDGFSKEENDMINDILLGDEGVFNGRRKTGLMSSDSEMELENIEVERVEKKDEKQIKERRKMRKMFGDNGVWIKPGENISDIEDARNGKVVGKKKKKDKSKMKKVRFQLEDDESVEDGTKDGTEDGKYRSTASPREAVVAKAIIKKRSKGKKGTKATRKEREDARLKIKDQPQSAAKVPKRSRGLFSAKNKVGVASLPDEAAELVQKASENEPIEPLIKLSGATPPTKQSACEEKNEKILEQIRKKRQDQSLRRQKAEHEKKSSWAERLTVPRRTKASSDVKTSLVIVLPVDHDDDDDDKVSGVIVDEELDRPKFRQSRFV